jgi:cephalosporin-C deacetylase
MQHNLSFDPTYGYSPETLRTVKPPPPPPDFADFWRATFNEHACRPPNPTRRPIASPHADYDLFELEYDSWDDFRTRGWLSVPKDETVESAFVIGHGYGGRTAPELPPPLPAAAALFPCARGFNRSAHPRFPDSRDGHVLHGISARETYIHRGCAAELWSAVSVLLEYFPQTTARLFYCGTSFGGGIGALALPWDNRFKKAFLGLPSFGHHPIRKELRCVGSGHAVKRYWRKNPDAGAVLAYFDSAVAAQFIRIPVFVAAALFDPAVPPPGQFAVFNALSCEKKLFTLSAGHFIYPEQAAEKEILAENLADWFGH